MEGYRQVGVEPFRRLISVLRQDHSQTRLHLQYQLEKGI